MVEKGYGGRQRGLEDGWVVSISLSEGGRSAYERHAGFHREMIEVICSALTPEEMAALVKALEKLKGWFKELSSHE